MRSQDRLHGDVNLAPPTSWQIIGYAIAATFAVAGVYISTAHYPRTSVAKGLIESDRGVLPVRTDLPGLVATVMVAEGQHVRRGQPLLRIVHDTRTGDGSLQDRRADAARTEVEAINQREPAVAAASLARIEGLRSEIEGAEADLRETRAQMVEQEALIAAAEDDLARGRAVALNGFISQQDIRRREESLATRRQGMSRLRQTLGVANATIARATSEIQRERAVAASALGEIAASSAAARGRAASSETAPETIVTATTPGTVVGLDVSEGELLDGSRTAMTLVPDGGSLRVRLLLPDEASSSIEAGQMARLAIDAFPYQTYGTISARIDRVSPTAIPDRTTERTSFVAIATMAADSLASYGRQRRLRPGMKVTARIVTMDRTLLQWLLDPLYAVSRR